jgi:hypothetical protein
MQITSAFANNNAILYYIEYLIFINKLHLRAPLKTRFFEAGKFLKAEFTKVNEHFKNEAQRRKSSF